MLWRLKICNYLNASRAMLMSSNTMSTDTHKSHMEQAFFLKVRSFYLDYVHWNNWLASFRWCALFGIMNTIMTLVSLLSPEAPCTSPVQGNLTECGGLSNLMGSNFGGHPTEQCFCTSDCVEFGDCCRDYLRLDKCTNTGVYV